MGLRTRKKQKELLQNETGQLTVVRCWPHQEEERIDSVRVEWIDIFGTRRFQIAITLKGGGTSEMGDQSDDCDLRWSPQASAPSSTMRRHGDQQRYHDARPVATKDVPKTSPARSASTPVNAVEIALQRPNSDDCFCGYLSRGASPIRSSFSLTWLPSRWSASFCSCSL